MTDRVVISFAATEDLREMLKRWARKEDRTVSATLRQIIEAEARRRQVEAAKADRQN